MAKTLSKAVEDFKKKYPCVTSADLQTFIIGWNEAEANRDENDDSDVLGVMRCLLPEIEKLDATDDQKKWYVSTLQNRLNIVKNKSGNLAIALLNALYLPSQK